jgi:UPF0755 protein
MKRGRAGGCLLRLVALAAAFAALACGILAFLLTRPYRGFSGESAVLEFPKGTSTAAIATQLAETGVVQSRWQFLMVRALRPTARLQAGEYRFSTPESSWRVFDRIVRGDVFFYEITIPEGSNIFDIAAIVGQLGFVKAADFLRVARNPAPIRDLDPGAPSLEGYLFPSTYRITRSATAQQLARMMVDLFRRRWEELPKPPGALPVNQAVTLASMIEKETAVADERTLVASVYWNRLRRGVTLDCDPTTIYAALLDNRYRGVIHRSDLDSANEYNTYRHVGLPPGPIASPGLASLEAALHPAETDYLFFVARPDGSGRHHFSETIAEHDRAVQDYRRNHR